jgi:hypothetical protein
MLDREQHFNNASHCINVTLPFVTLYSALFYLKQEYRVHLILINFFETGSYYVAQVGLKPVILVHQPPKYWDSRHMPSHLTLMIFLM